MLVASCVGAAGCLVLSNPFDVIKTRVQSKAFDVQTSARKELRALLANEVCKTPLTLMNMHMHTLMPNAHAHDTRTHNTLAHTRTRTCTSERPVTELRCLSANKRADRVCTHCMDTYMQKHAHTLMALGMHTYTHTHTCTHSFKRSHVLMYLIAAAI